jgi:hypothetical protein
MYVLLAKAMTFEVNKIVKPETIRCLIPITQLEPSSPLPS